MSMKKDIDSILDMLSWNNSTEIQKTGLLYAKDVKCIYAFIQPRDPWGKDVWENCAITLSERSDDVLAPILQELFEWTQDMNWPGAQIIYNRLHRYANDRIDFQCTLEDCMRIAELTQDDIWALTLNEFANLSD